MLNQAQLDPVLDRHGFAPVDPAAMSPAEVITTFRDAEVVLGVTGSGLANTVFSRSAHVVELLPGQELLPHCFTWRRRRDCPTPSCPHSPIVTTWTPTSACAAMSWSTSRRWTNC